ncbi:unnamed protein product [Arabis nemorensis]|uniref:Uncharacterized protein n=1 Tax=Arabis nemorensis TaxID=586526 RepID=A0A565BHM6_9BRAS|nr:unnamed protein product [Arabis nemorensis]
MGNNNATASLTEEESSKVETNGKSLLDSVSVETTQDQLFLASEEKDGDKEKESLSDAVTGKETPETEPQSKELVEASEAKNVEEEKHQSDLESLVTETYEQFQKQTSIGEGVETVCEVIQVEELSMIGTQSVVSKLNTTETGNEEKPCVIDEIVLISPSFYETEIKMVNESLEEISSPEEVVKLDQETGMEQRTGFPEIEPREVLNLEIRVVDDDDEVTNEGKANLAISKPSSHELNAIQETGLEVYKEEKDTELGREASLKRMSRCRSLPVSQNSRVIGDSLVQQLVSEVVFPSRNKIGIEKANTSETLLLSCVGSNKEARLEMRSPTFGNDIRHEERSDESMEETPLLSQDKTKTCEAQATIVVEEKTVMLNRSETEKTRGIELSLGLSMKPSRQSEADDSFNETKGSVDNLLDKKVNPSETLLLSCVESNKAQVTTEAITERNKEAILEMRSPSFGNDLKIEERSNESTEKTLLLCQEKTETYEATINVEKKTVMLKRSESEKTRGFELSRGLSMKLGERSEADNRFKGSKSSGENLLEKKALLGSMKGRVRKRSKSLLFGTCLCCNTAMN